MKNKSTLGGFIFCFGAILYCCLCPAVAGRASQASDKPPTHAGPTAAAAAAAAASSSSSPPPPQQQQQQQQQSSLTAIERLIDSGQLPRAREQLKSVVAHAHGEPLMVASALYLEAKLLFMERRFVDSIKQLERLLRAKLARPADLTADGIANGELYAEPPYPEALKLMGLNHVLLNRLDQAEPFLRASTALVPADHLARFHLGLLYYTTSRFALAERELREAVKLRPAFVKGHDALGLTLEELGMGDEAAESYRRAVELSRHQARPDGSPYLNFGRYLMRKNRFAESLSLLRRAVEITPASAEGFFLLGKALNKTGAEAQAVQALLRAAELDHRYPEPHYLLSRIYLQQGRKPEAERELQTFHEIRKLKTDAQ